MTFTVSIRLKLWKWCHHKDPFFRQDEIFGFPGEVRWLKRYITFSSLSEHFCATLILPQNVLTSYSHLCPVSTGAKIAPWVKLIEDSADANKCLENKFKDKNSMLDVNSIQFNDIIASQAKQREYINEFAGVFGKATLIVCDYGTPLLKMNGLF